MYTQKIKRTCIIIFNLIMSIFIKILNAFVLFLNLNININLFLNLNIKYESVFEFKH